MRTNNKGWKKLIGDFTFHSVGQGLFYSGSIYTSNSSFNIIYDCGGTVGNYRNKNANNQFLINAILQQPKQIDWLIISHLHDDHINGIPFLLKHSKVKQIILPYFDVQAYKNIFVAYIIANSIFPNTPLFTLLCKWYRCIFDTDSSFMLNNDMPDFKIHFISEKEQFLQPNGIPWMFKFFNKQVSQQKFQRFQNRLNLLLNGQTIEQYIYSAKGNYALLKAQFSLIFKNNNLTSLVLLHYKHNSIKTLLTGDIESDRGLNHRLELCCQNDNQLVMQTPHHGAKIAWDKFSKPIKYNARQVLSFGYGNAYGHPNANVITDMINNNLTVVLVNQLYSYHYSVF